MGPELSPENTLRTYVREKKREKVAGAGDFSLAAAHTHSFFFFPFAQGDIAKDRENNDEEKWL